MRFQLLAVVPVLLAGTAVGQIRFQGLGLPADPSQLTGALSADGSTIVGSFTGVGGAFRWRELTGIETLRPLAAPGRANAYPIGVSGDGRFVAGTSDSATVPGGAEAVRWDAAGNVLALGDLPGGSFDSFGSDVSDDGSVVVGTGTPSPNGMSIFRRTDVMTNLGERASSLPNDGVRVSCTGDGQTVFGRLISGEPGRWRNGSWISLGDLPGLSRNGWVHGISRSGDYAVGVSIAAEGSTGFRWSEARGMEWLGYAPIGNYDTTARSVSDDGAVVVGDAGTGWLSRAAIWDQVHGWRNLKLVLMNEYGMDEVWGWTLTSAFGISGDGHTIAGWGMNTCGRPDMWIARLLPPAGSCAADFNEDGFLDFFDFDDFVAAFQAGRGAADFNGDCFLDFFDVDSFVAAFERGC